MPNDLDEVHSRFRAEVQSLKEFALNLVDSLSDTSGKGKTSVRITDEQKRMASDYLEEQLVPRLKDMKSAKEFSEIYKECADKFGSFGFPEEYLNPFRDMAKAMQHIHFLDEMVVVYLVTLQEAFVRDYLRAVSHIKPSLLKSERKLDLTFEDACNFTSLEGFKDYLIDEAIEPATRSIDEASSYFEKRLQLKLDEFTDWQKVREASHRRNLIVHNRGEVNRTYRDKTGYKGLDGYLAITVPYISDAADAIMGFFDFVHDRVSRQLG